MLLRQRVMRCLEPLVIGKGGGVFRAVRTGGIATPIKTHSLEVGIAPFGTGRYGSPLKVLGVTVHHDKVGAAGMASQSSVEVTVVVTGTGESAKIPMIELDQSVIVAGGVIQNCRPIPTRRIGGSRRARGIFVCAAQNGG